MRTALFLAFLAANPAYAQDTVNMLEFNQLPTPDSRPAVRVQVGRDGVLYVQQETPGIITICGTGPSSVVTTHGRQVTIRNGRLCRSGERPQMTLDTSSCVVLTGTYTGSVSMTCSASRD